MTSPDAPPSLDPTPGALSLLSAVHQTVGASRAGRGLLAAIQLRRIARLWLRAAILGRYRSLPDEVTVLIGIRDRTDHRLPLALRSLREQTHPSKQVRIVVVDYGSGPEAAALTARRCLEHGARYIRVDTEEVWSRSRCLNAGIRRATTKFLLTSDVDIIFSPRYVEEAIEALRSHPLSVVGSAMLDLTEDTAESLRRIGETGEGLRLEEWKASSRPRQGWRFHPSIGMTYTAFHHLIRGYDEFFEVWGLEDEDLFRRFLKLGLERRVLESDSAFYLHQWHPKFESLPDEVRALARRRNAERWRKVQSIVRNDAEWGAAGAVSIQTAAHQGPSEDQSARRG